MRRFIEAAILYTRAGPFLEYPTLDAGCGDGMFSTILFGGQFENDGHKWYVMSYLYHIAIYMMDLDAFLHRNNYLYVSQS